MKETPEENSKKTEAGTAPEKSNSTPIVDSNLEFEELKLEIKFLRKDTKKIYRLNKILMSGFTVVATVSAIFLGWCEFNTANNVSLRDVEIKEKNRIDKNFEMLDSDDIITSKQGSIGLISFVKNSKHLDQIYGGLETRLSLIQRPDPNKYAYPEFGYPEVERNIVRPFTLIVDEFNLKKRESLYLALFNNKSLRYSKLLALEKLKPKKDYWEIMLDDPWAQVRREIINSLIKKDYPFVNELLIKASQDTDSIVANIALSELDSRK